MNLSTISRRLNVDFIENRKLLQSHHKDAVSRRDSGHLQLPKTVFDVKFIRIVWRSPKHDLFFIFPVESFKQKINIKKFNKLLYQFKKFNKLSI